MRFVLSVLALAGVLISDSPAAKRNVVLFVSDDHGMDAGCYGNPVIRTPNMDKLAADGTLFNYAFCTTASCSASRSVILSGLYNHYNGQYGHQHSYHHFISFDRVQSLPVLLSDGGYRTIQVGKYHVAPQDVYRFDHYVKVNTRSPVEMADRCREFVTAEEEKPFFIYFCTSDPHRGGGQAHDLPYKPDRFGNRPQGYPGVKEVTYDPEDVIVPPFLPDTLACRAELVQYYQSVSRVDQGMGRLIQILQKAGRWDDTLFIYISDNGIAFPGAKTTAYEPGLRLPCVVRNPYLEKRGLAANAMITWADLTPTILDFANVKPKGSPFHGRSFLSVLDQEEPGGWDEIYASHTFHEITMYYPMRVVRGRQYKLIWNIAHQLPYPFASDLWAAPTFQDRYQQGLDTLYGKRSIRAYIHRPEFQLYDLENDPHEVRDLANDAAHAGVLGKLKGKIRAFQERTKDPWIMKWEYE